MIEPKKRWRIKPANKEIVDMLSKHLGVSPFLATLLVSRGIKTKEAAELFLFAGEDQFYDPFLLHDMKKSIDRIELAIRCQEKILIYGDYDADGVDSTAILLTALKQKNANVHYYIPDRFAEGYGPNEDAFRRAANEGVSVIITVDNGIAALHEANVAKELGIDLIITDHHQMKDQLPDAYSIIHPKLSDQYPFHELCGAGVAFKVAHALLGQMPLHLIEYAAIGTVCDLVPLVDENRYLVKAGLKALSQTDKPGIKALLKVSGLSGKEISEEDIGFLIGPRINAVGRLQSAEMAVHLLTITDEQEALELAEEVNLLNEERQALVNRITEEAIQLIESSPIHQDSRVLVIGKEGWNAGVIGIVASRLVDKYYKPTIVFSFDAVKNEAKGSARSIDGFNLYENLSECSDILPHFGGHYMAAGMTLRLDDVDELRERLSKLAGEKLTEEDLKPILDVDAVLTVQEIQLSLLDEIKQLGPFGVSNPFPHILLKDASFSQMRQIGSDKNHLKLMLTENDQSLDVIGFQFGDYALDIAQESRLSVVGKLSLNEWNGFQKVQLMLEDLAVSSTQLFDLRSSRNLHEHLLRLPKEKVTLLAFKEETIEKLNLEQWENHVRFCQNPFGFDFSGQYVFLLDLPNTIFDLKQLFKQSTKPDRLYMVFYHEQENFFTVLPSRDHFKYYYQVIMKKQTFPLSPVAKQIAAYKKWKVEMVYFMTEVFFELGFVTIEDGIVQCVNHPEKKDLFEAKTYKRKQQQIELEQLFLFSSYHQLKLWFDTIQSEG